MASHFGVSIYLVGVWSHTWSSDGKALLDLVTEIIGCVVVFLRFVDFRNSRGSRIQSRWGPSGQCEVLGPLDYLDLAIGPCYFLHTRQALLEADLLV